MDQCVICKEECENYGEHVRKKHPIGCQEVIKSITSQAKLDKETEERTIYHLADCRPCRDALKAGGNALVEKHESRKAFAEMNAHSCPLL